MVVGIVVSSCSGYDDEFLLLPDTPDTPTTEDNNDGDENEDIWESVMDDWYTIENNHSLIVSHKETNLNEYVVEAPFSATLGEDLYFVTEDSQLSEFQSLSSIATAPTIYGDWYANEESDSIRMTELSQSFECNLYTRSLVISNAQAYRFINGQRDAFLMPTVVTSFAGHSSEVREIERNDSVFNRETIMDSVKIAFSNRPDIAPVFISAKTVIDHFLRVKDQGNDEIENMPTPDITVGEDIVSISDRTATPVYANNTITWYEASLVKTIEKTYVIINGQHKETWENSSLASVDWCNSAMYDTVTEKWIPCHLAMDSSNTGWSYTFQLADGTYRQLCAPMNAALISSLKSFLKDNDAAQTPFLSTGSVKSTYADGDFYTVSGLYTYTAAHK